MNTTKTFPASVAVAALSVSLIGCASMKDNQMSSGSNSAVLAEKDQEIDRLSAQVASMETTLSEEQKMAAARNLNVRSDLLPPKAKPGQCFARAFIPPEYEIETVRVLKSEASKRVETAPAQFEAAEERVLVKEASEQLQVVPATYEWVQEKILVKPESTKLVSVPAKYKTVTDKVLDKPEHTVWKKGSGPITKIDEGTGEIMCLVTIPATYKTVTKRVLVSDATTQEITIPAEYKTVKKRVMKTPPTTNKITIPAEYRTVKVRKLVKSAETRTVEIPETYGTVKRRNMVAEGHVEWRPVLCETNMSSDVVRRIQAALDNAGFNPGPVDGVIGRGTMSAVKQYQQSKGLATGGLTIQTLESLKVSL